MKLETMTVNRVDYKELESHIRQVYSFEDPRGMFSIVLMEEWTNDSDHLFHVRKEPLDKWEQEEFNTWKADPLGFHQYRLHVILQDMANNGHISKGDLLIGVCW